MEQQFKKGDIVFIKDQAWFNANKGEDGLVWNIDKDNDFTYTMRKYLGQKCEVIGAFGKSRVLKLVTPIKEDEDLIDDVISYVFYDEWLTKDLTKNQKEEQKDSDIYNLQVHITKARSWFNSENSELQELAMLCFPIKRLIE